MEFPDRQRCLALLKGYNVPQHIVCHSLRVAQIGVFLANRLRMVGEDIEIGMVEAGGLLHDITKWDSIRTGRNHALSGGELLESLGYPDVADIVRQHVHLDGTIKDNMPVSEALVVNYADKRVKHESIVTLSERLEDLLKRYGTTPRHRERLKRLCREVETIETVIFKKLDIEPAELNRLKGHPAHLLMI